MRIRLYGLYDVVPWCGNFLKTLEDADLITGGLKGLVRIFGEIQSNFKDLEIGGLDRYYI